jgi:hypothetical protein
MPIVQEKYILLQQLDSLVEKTWNALLVTKPEVSDVNVVQEFVAGSILVRKWQDMVTHYEIFYEESLSIVSDLDLRLKETTTRRHKVDLGQVKDCGRGLLGPSFLIPLGFADI